MKRTLDRAFVLTAIMACVPLGVACGNDGDPEDPEGDSGLDTTTDEIPGDTGRDASVETGRSSNSDGVANSSDHDGGERGGTSEHQSTPGHDHTNTEDIWSSSTAAAPSSSTHHSSSSGENSGSSDDVGSPDLVISGVTLGAGFTSVEVPDSSCEIQDGCYTGSGERTVIPFELTVKNMGSGPLRLGSPWENDAFYLSACASQYRTSNFVKAEVLGENGQVVAVSHLPTACVAAANSAEFTCSIQGLDVGEESVQPSHACRGLDVTGLAAGAYSVRFTVNAKGSFHEQDTSNNTFEVALEKPACEERFCGGVCCPESAACVDDQCLLPDLRANQDAVERSLIIRKQTFSENACEIEEQCITGPGKRRLLQFEGRIENIGTGDLNPGREQNNPLFEYSQCHGHFHFLDFTDYKLLNADGSVAVQGHKQSFCLVDMERVADYDSPVFGEIVHPEPGPSGCSYLSAGWADIYSVGTPCQWVDVTDVPAGDYMLQVAVNPSGKISEGNVENNVVQVPVHIPADAPCQEQEICGDVVDQDCDGLPDAGDEDCHATPFCCGAADVCGLGDNWQCDCEGLPAWEHHDCDSASGDGGAANACCSEDDSCNWANDGVCDCGGQFAWDEQDCERNCCTPWGGYYCGLTNNDVCDCDGQFAWDFDDCGGPGDGGIVTIPVDECCTDANACDWAEDEVCDCGGAFAWDAVDCAQSDAH